MTEAQKRVLEWIGVAVLVAAAAFMVTLVYQVMTGAYLTGVDSESPELSFAWRQAATLIGLGGTANVVFAAALAILTTAVGLVAKAYDRTVEVAAVVVVCVVGLAAGFVLLGEVDASVANEIRYHGGFAGDPTAGLDRIRAFAFAMIGWFGVYAATMLGVNVAEKTGALDKLIARLRGA